MIFWIELELLFVSVFNVVDDGVIGVSILYVVIYLNGLKILIVEDVVYNWDVFVEVFKEYGCDLVVVVDG